MRGGKKRDDEKGKKWKGARNLLKFETTQISKPRSGIIVG